MVKLERMRLGDGLNGEVDLRIDWSNDRHHAVAIKHPGGPDEVADALRELARIVFSDKELRTAEEKVRP